jgi:hypothetical protein
MRPAVGVGAAAAAEAADNVAVVQLYQGRKRGVAAIDKTTFEDFYIRHGDSLCDSDLTRWESLATDQ